VLTALSFSFEFVTALSASFISVTEASAIFVVDTDPSASFALSTAPVLIEGSGYVPLRSPPASRDTFLIAREYGQDSVIAVVNRGVTEASVSVSREDLMEGEDGGMLYISGSYTDLLSGARFDTSGGRLDLSLGPLTGMLLCRR
jgi:hypothetical protein